MSVAAVYDALDQHNRKNASKPHNSAQSQGPEARRSGDERRQSPDRRRSSRGLYENRARREGIVDDRRRQQRRERRMRFMAQCTLLSRLLGPFKSSH
ncbi:MAG: hypothetical protein ACR2PZ_12615 [Pseudomonadales bacterium]